MGASFSFVIGMVFRPYLVVVNGSKHSPLSFISEIAEQRLSKCERTKPRRMRAVGMISSRSVSWQQRAGGLMLTTRRRHTCSGSANASKSLVEPGGAGLLVRWRCRLGEGENKMDVIRIRRHDRAASGDHKARGVLFLSSMW